MLLIRLYFFLLFDKIYKKSKIMALNQSQIKNANFRIKFPYLEVLLDRNVDANR